MTVDQQETTTAPPATDGLSRWLNAQLLAEEIVEVPVDQLSIADSPRISGENPEHVQALCEVEADLPPIVVHHQSMRVIDGAHRLAATIARGGQSINVRFFHGSAADAFVLAVNANITHGLPLPLADRRAAAARIIASHQQWSDRMIAATTGLAPRTVAMLRRHSGQQTATLEARIGRDGRVRPTNGAERRILASRIIAAQPGISLRQVAQAAGLSPETVRDVRNRLRNGQDPVPPRASRRAGASGSGPHAESTHFENRASAPGDPGGADGSTPTEVLAVPGLSTLDQTVKQLSADPALRYSESGRTLLRLLHYHMLAARNWGPIGRSIPTHAADTAAGLARQHAEMWLSLARHLEHRYAWPQSTASA